MSEAQAILEQPYIADSMLIENIPANESVLRRPVVKSQTGLSDTGIDERIAMGTFPKSILLGGRARGWIQSDIALWIKKRVIISNDPKASKAEANMRATYMSEKARRRGLNDSNGSGETADE